MAYGQEREPLGDEIDSDDDLPEEDDVDLDDFESPDELDAVDAVEEPGGEELRGEDSY